MGKVSLFIGAGRALFMPFGFLALFVIGAHVGGDRLDDGLFEIFNHLDVTMDHALAWAIAGLGGFFGASDSTIDLLTYRAIDCVDIEAKIAAGRSSALMLELALDVAVAAPILFSRSEQTRLSEIAVLSRRALRDPTLLAIVLPVTIALACTAGVFALAREVQVATHSMVSGAGVAGRATAFSASVAGLSALVLSAWRLGVPSVLGAFAYSHRRAESDRILGVPGARRRMRGLSILILGIPIAALAVRATPIAGSLRALLWS